MVELTDKVKLNEWISFNRPSKDHEYSRLFWDQVNFVQNELPVALIPRNDLGTYKAVVNNTRVISTYTSKTVVLPVYEMGHPSGLRFIMRCNFADWKVSVISNNPVVTDFGNLLNPEQTIPDYYCEGFPKTWVFVPYSKSKLRFTAEVQDNNRLFVFFWLVSRSLNLHF